MASLEEEEDLCERGQYSEDIEIKIAKMHSGEKWIHEEQYFKYSNLRIYFFTGQPEDMELRVWRYLSCKAAGDCSIIIEASLKHIFTGP